MATAYDFFGANTTSKYTGGISNKMGAGLIDGRVKVFFDTLACSTSITSGKKIQIAGYGNDTLGNGFLPAGASILAIIISCTVAQTSATLNVGDGASATRYASASTVLQTANLGIVIPGTGYVIGTATNDNFILLTTGGATLQATGTISVIILYTTD